MRKMIQGALCLFVFAFNAQAQPGEKKPQKSPHAAEVQAMSLDEIQTATGLNAQEVNARIAETMTGDPVWQGGVLRAVRLLPADGQESFLRGAFSAAKAYASSEAFAEEYIRKLRARSASEDTSKLPNTAEALVRERLQFFVDTCAAVDFNAKLQVQAGTAKFVEAEHEEKPPLWKACYRAGPRQTKVAVELARAWLKESPQAAGAVRPPAETGEPVLKKPRPEDLDE